MTRASDRAYAKIRAFLLGGGAHPGEQVTEERLAEIAGVSRTPVREAMRRLENELLLVRSPSKRIFVADWSRDDIDEMFTLRQMLEGHAAKRAATRLTAQEIDRLEAVNGSLREAIAGEPPDIVRFLEANRRFHDIITGAARSPRLGQVLAMLVEQPVLVRTARHYSVRDLRQSARDHDELIAAFRAGDPDWAQAVMKSHLRRAFHTFADAAEAEGGAAKDAAE
ncbi:DNA-binding transcriptional regulator, GntR family [Erythrobacter litoralis]|uniref:GntR family transcriptional regulator n=1 Tax=Erythrobacter litoralis TaxID=39960 RepID=A0A074NGF5_9SPHN|nr:GntR family transcriptional regulator [Erythrobacter litoralis]AOL24719.1 DNA-binding transcriptional regulator, GntR family [Erythrobacter litoralis]KEO96697.1 GntR family transcriptional regulator [Erythrobacter litoralis]